MKQRILLAEIPSREFHSAIFTTYSINLYYLEQQVLPLLDNKGIHYVSVLVDSEILSAQLDSLSTLSDNKKRSYAINGMQCKGAFHSKLIFLAGVNRLLLLMGSGNLTSCGHGKNLEVWNAFYVDSVDDPKLGFLLQAWNYLKYLHKGLGNSSSNRIRNIEDNCSLLKSNITLQERYLANNNTHISLLYSQPKKSLFNQLVSVIGSEKIKRIIVMSPFYDTDGKFLKLLNNSFKPETIHALLQRDFGNAPTGLKQLENIHFHDWEDVKCNVPQKFFHAKNIIFEGERTNYLLSGSANASIAAFGSDKTENINHEVCVLYQSKSTDYLDILELKLKKKKADLNEYGQLNYNSETESSSKNNLVFILSAERSYDLFSMNISSESYLSNLTLCIFDASGKLQIDQQIETTKPEMLLTLNIQPSLSIMYCCLMKGEIVVSNKQFITDIHAFESTNPSQRNRSLYELRKLIEIEGFSTIKIIEYLNDLNQNNKPYNLTTTNSSNKNNDKEIIDIENDLTHLSYQQLQEKIRFFDNSRNGSAYVEYQSVRLWESIISYIKDSKERIEQSKIDEEETENINESSGREEHSFSQKKQQSQGRLLRKQNNP